MFSGLLAAVLVSFALRTKCMQYWNQQIGYSHLEQYLPLVLLPEELVATDSEIQTAY